MKRRLAAMLAAILVLGPIAVPGARADVPFETVPLPAASSRPHRAAYTCLAAGVGLIATSFVLARDADRSYEGYLTAREPQDIQRRFDETSRYDRWSSGTLFAGEAFVAAGLYLRFLRRPPPPIAVTLLPGSCAVSFRF